MLFDVIGIENADLSDKSGQIWLWKKIIIVIWNNTPETMTKQQRCLEKKKTG